MGHYSSHRTHSSNNVRSARRAHSAVRAAAFEALECRQLMANGSWQPLVIPCTTGNDVVTITREGDFLKVINNGVTTSHRWKSVQIPGSTPGSTVTLKGISKVVVNGEHGNDCILADDTVTVPLEAKGGAGDDMISGGVGNDTIYGGANALQNVYESGSDTVTGRDGNDKLCSPKYGRASINAGAGHDTVTGGSGDDSIDAGEGNDRVDAGMGYDNVHGRGGSDFIMGGWEADTIYGEGENDTINGGDGNDRIEAGAGHDTVHGDDPDDLNRTGNDTVYGGEGWDTVDGGNGEDKIFGDGGRDWFIHSPARDFYHGGADLDSLDYRATGNGVRVKLTTSSNGSNGNGPAGQNDYVHNDIEAAWGGTGNDTLEGSNNADSLFGGIGNDSIRGYNGADSLSGGVGFDTIMGDAGMDNISGGDNDDEIHGGADSDYLYGDGGSDLIVAIGGGSADGCYGGSGDDSIWMDLTQWEKSDATSAEKNAGRFHAVNVFFKGVSKEIEGQKIADPTVDLNALGGYTSFGDKPLFGSAGINRHDVSQGQIGNCGFVAGLANIADKRGSRIRESIVDLRDGTFAVRFNFVGVESYARIDNDLPVRVPSTKKLAYARLGNGGAMWVALLEKTEALIQGGYGALWGIHPSVPFNRYGFGTTEHWNDDVNGMLNDLSTRLNQGKMVTAWTGSFTLDTTKPILPIHAYEVVQVNKGTGMIQIYNPWGTDTNGDFVQGSDDGLIWVSAQQFNDKFINAVVAS